MSARFFGLASAVVLAGALRAAPEPSPEPPSLAERVRKGMTAGAEYLAKNQDPQGAWGIVMPPKPGEKPAYRADCGITALALYAMARCPDRQKFQGAIGKGVTFLMSRRREDGSFADPDGMLVNYKTSIALLALAEIDPGKYREEISLAKDAIVKSVRMDPSDVRNFGGAGYLPGKDGRGSDLNNSAFAAEAIRRAEELGIPVDQQVYKALETYVTRVQNLEMTNDILKELGRAVREEDAGGFPYRPEESKATEDAKPIVLPDGRKVYPSYGSMTYAGLLSFIYARVAGDDPRVVAAWNWIQRHWTLDRNPGMAVPRTNPAKAQEGLYYYYHTMAKACSKYGKDVIEDAGGQRHAWGRELSEKLLSLQASDGSWVNEADRWYEGSKALVTSYTLVSLSYCLPEVERSGR